jgi:hypothetical protein
MLSTLTAQASFVIAMTMPARTKTRIAAWVQYQKGVIALQRTSFSLVEDL